MPNQVAAVATALPDRLIIAVDGVDGAGKTYFADQLAPLIASHGRPDVRASVDGFHSPPSIRYRRGRSDALGFFLDSYNYDVLKLHLVEPFRRGEGRVETQRFDHKSDQAVSVSENVQSTALLVLDGIFLHRDELNHLFDFSVFLNVPFSLSFQRMALRDGSDPDPHAESNRRYYLGQMHHLHHCKPQERASIVVDW